MWMKRSSGRCLLSGFPPYLREPSWVDPEVTFRILRRTGVLFGKISEGIFQQMVFAIVLGKMCF